MSKRDLPASKAADLPERMFYTPGEVSAMSGIEYEGVLAAIKSGEIPGERIGVRYYVSAWWVNKHLTGEQSTESVDLAGRGTA